MSVYGTVMIGLGIAALSPAQETISFLAQDNAHICADLYGSGKSAVILAHGGRFTKESWQPQAQILASKDSKS